MHKILLVEDDPNLGLVINDNLTRNGYAVTLATDGSSAWDAFKSNQYDLCILDVMLPQKDGFTLAKDIRNKNTAVPILFLTAKSMEEDRLNGFKSGGDDYITKPFSMKELIFRIEVFLKRSAKPQDNDIDFTIGQYKFDYQNLQLHIADHIQTLTQKEANLLKHLCEHQGQVVKRAEILEAVWGSDDYFLGRSMDVFISKLRKYLQKDPCIQIKNIHGVGFQLEINLGV
ncbi:response regulator transcription factor [Fulvivirga sp. RKSG066]|uniref:response regulator transcription factor n=1 Tax=Fulvivirga aurantia TaxID=2529383 RepID=UPI0012BCF17E|nr:response regulator transcription factor [Fulvivirga aurantia]MTI23112.1 response regulator transcription factor [Fulvivirga aurantia]